MGKQELSPREAEIVVLAAEGLTNEEIARQLDLSVGTVNTYWLRIKLKTGGVGRTDTVLNIFKKRHENELEEERVDWEGLDSILAKREVLDVVAEKAREVELRTTMAMLQLAMGHVRSTIWATDHDLCIHNVVNGDLPSTRFGVTWEDGKTVYEIFKTEDKAHPAVAAHFAALEGSASEQRLGGEFTDLFLRVLPVADEFGDVVCCISILEKNK